MNTETNTETMSLDTIAAEFNAAGFPAYVAQSGGGCATIYVGPWFRDPEGDQTPAWMVGPGWFDGPNNTNAHAWRDELSFGDGFGADKFYVGISQNDTAGTFAMRCVAFIEQNFAALVEYARTEAEATVYNGIG